MKSSSKPRAKQRPLRLPTMEVLLTFSLRKRTALFLKWADRQGNRRYDSQNSSECAFARFGAALGVAGARGGNYGFDNDELACQVIPDVHPKVHRAGSSIHIDSPIHPRGNVSNVTTFAALVRRARTFLKQKGLEWNPTFDVVW